MSTAVLLTGFGPFPGAPRNPSGALALCLARRRRPALADARRIVHVLRASYTAIERELPALIARHQPRAILMFGLAPRARRLRIETQARNVASPLFADAQRAKPAKQTLSANGPARRPARAPCVRLLRAARGAGVPAELSRDAGRYLCNAAFWRALEAARRGGPLVVFVHVPPLRRIRLAKLARAGEAILLALVAAARRAS